MKKDSPLPPVESPPVVAASEPGGGEISSETRAKIISWLRETGKRQPAAYLAKVISNGNLAALVDDFNAARAAAQAAAASGWSPRDDHMYRDRPRSERQRGDGYLPPDFWSYQETRRESATDRAVSESLALMTDDDSARQVAAPPLQTPPAIPAPRRLGYCDECARTLQLDALGRLPDHDGDRHGRQCQGSGSVSYAAAAAILRRTG